MKLLIVMVWFYLLCYAHGEPSKAQAEFFEKKIRPVLSEYCFKCHSNKSKKLKGDLYLDSLKGMMKGGEAGSSLDLKNPDSSILIKAIAYEDEDIEMPPKKRLPKSIVDDFRKWVKMGAPWPGGGAKFVEKKKFDFEKRKKEHWAWQPIKKYTPPAGNEIDYFIEAKRKSKGLKANLEADRRTLIRRLSYDLTGLPPKPAEIKVFLTDSRPDAYERLVDKLLANSHFGEKWARHWMDSVRYAESLGHEFDPTIPNTHPYRDYLIRAYNQDVPYDQFLKEHIAGDLLPEPRRDAKGMNESLLATAFYYFGEMVHAPTDVGHDEADRIDNQIDVMTKTFLGTTVACARCHDHKFDPIRAKDYYALSSFMQSTRLQQGYFDSSGKINAGLNKLASILKQNQSTITDQQASQFNKYLYAAGEAMNLYARQNSTAVSEDFVFEDFEKDLSKWKVSGDAFNSSPAAGRVGTQKEVKGFKGKKLLNSYNKTDQSIGTMVSKPFKISHNNISLLVGGGNHNTTSVSLKIGKKQIYIAKGRAQETLFPVSWDVRKLKGETAVIEIVDKHKGGWGHINVDHIIFTNKSSSSGNEILVSDGVIATVAKKRKLSSALLKKWIVILQKKHPLAAWSKTFDAKKGFTGKAGIHKTKVWKSNLNKAKWFTSGFAFDKRFGDSQPLDGSVSLGQNVISSRRISTKMQGNITSPDFTLTDKGVSILIRAQGAQVRLIIENYQMEPRSGLLFGGTRQKVETNGEYKVIRFNPRKYKGKTCYLEFSDEGKGYFDIAAIDFAGQSNFQPVELAGHDGSKISSFNTLVSSIHKYWQAAHKAGKKGKANAAQQEYIDWVSSNGLLSNTKSSSSFGDILKTIPNADRVISASDGTAFEDYVHIRGSYKSKGESTPRRFLEVFAGKDLKPFPGAGSGRLQLAEHMVHSNPLSSRVMVNRLWHHLFGRGIVATVDDFGVMGQKPTHPKLLDWLATDFIKNKWSVKTMIKKMVMSKTYRQSSKSVDKSAELKDPDNLSLHRMRVRRMTAEQIRDGLLAVSQRLDKRLYGKSVDVKMTAFMEGRGRAKSGPLDGAGRRSLYLGVRRNFLSPMMLVFDFPVPFNSMGRRTVSNVPAQALTMMNDPFVHDMCRVWADKLLKSRLKGKDLINHIFESALGHYPTSQQVKIAESFLQGKVDKNKLQNLCHIVVNMKSFIYLN